MQATYCRCTARLLLCHSGSDCDCLGGAERGESVDITVPGHTGERESERERERERERKRKQRALTGEHSPDRDAFHGNITS